ncbi:MAG: biotin--[acetyl-CoA-carboxylase] ligase [Pseudomonadota bacterium]|nr:biotin--[acetyl-CoA-carboxylase] ligase [Pseudomonadota bacterium]
MGADWPRGYGVEILEETGSTMDEARARASAGVPGPVWIMARRQTAGRGRRGNAWGDPGGNLAATLLLRPRMGAKDAARLSFVSSLAVADMLGALAPGRRIETKWPNDALIEGGKVCGILLESEGRGEALDWVSVGIGVNLAHAPAPQPGAAFPPVALADLLGAAPDPEDALRELAAGFARWLDLYRAQGFGPLRDAWLARAARLGQRIEARLPRETVAGVFADLDPDGALILETPQGARKIAAAEVFFP